MDDSDAAIVERSTIVLAVSVALVGIVASCLIVGLRIANEGAEPEHENWWLVAWLVAGVVDAAAGATLLSRDGHRRLGTCLLVGGVVAVAVALATQADGYTASTDQLTAWEHVAGARGWGRPVAAGMLAALVPWQLVLGERRTRGGELIWWATAALIAITAVGHGLGSQRAGVDVVDVATWGVAISATCATAALVTVWWHAGRWSAEDPLWGWLACGTVAAWLALVPDRLDLADWRFPGVDVVGPLLLLATVPMLVVGVLVRALRERPGRLHGISQDVVGWMAFSGAVIVIYTGAVAGLGRRGRRQRADLAARRRHRRDRRARRPLPAPRRHRGRPSRVRRPR